MFLSLHSLVYNSTSYDWNLPGERESWITSTNYDYNWNLKAILAYDGGKIRFKIDTQVYRHRSRPIHNWMDWTGVSIMYGEKLECVIPIQLTGGAFAVYQQLREKKKGHFDAIKDASSLVIGVLLESFGTVIEHVCWLRLKSDMWHINVVELDVVIKHMNLSIRWEAKTLHIKTDSVFINGFLTR